ncbi:thioesterase II family protein [Kitasatospora azatica]|uniref:thioesterase II family protein n=1 Tax=Kitasatospora azatica TaxID=58347 RepID=UPI000569DF25|nr:alpha/beta fold hydrolase [Kitasatospora azatica]
MNSGQSTENPLWWSRPTSGRSAATARVLLCPHSGAGPAALLGLIELLPATVEVLALTLPGREHRFTEAPQTSPAELLASVDDELRPLPALPTVAVGHSVGALLAAAVADHLGPTGCQALVVSGQSPPAVPNWADGAVHTTDLLRLVRLGGETPESVLADDGWREFILARLRADLALGAQVRAGLRGRELRCPIAVLGGLDDPVVPSRTLAGWRAVTRAPFHPTALAGGHFAILAAEHRRPVAAALRWALDQAAGRFWKDSGVALPSEPA